MNVLIALFICHTLLSCQVSSNFRTQNLEIAKKISRPLIPIISLNGGYSNTNDAIEDDTSVTYSNGSDSDESEESDANADNAGDDDDFDVDGAGVTASPIMSAATDLWQKTPPITRLYISSSLFLTVATCFLNNNKWPKLFNLDWNAVLTRLEFWRPFTAFLYFGPLGINFVLTMQFVWQYMAQLEKMGYKSPADFFIQMVFGAVSLLVLYGLTGINHAYLGHNLSTYLVYIWARTFEGTEVSFMDLFTLKAELLPWFFSLQTYLLEGEIPLADLLGIAVGHLFYYLSKRNLLQPPEFLKKFFSSEYFLKEYSKFKEDFE